MARRSDGRPALIRRRRFRQAAAALALSAAVAAPVAGERAFEALVGRLAGLEALTPRTLQQVVDDAGGVPFPSEVPVEFLDAKGARKYLEEVVASEYPRRKADADARALLAFDLLPPAIDLQNVRLGLLSENIAGFYDERPQRRRLYVVSEDATLTPINQLILAHELRHALQDQHVDVHSRLPESVGDFDDRRLAFLAVLEGDATLVMEHFLRRRLETAGRDVPDLSNFMLPVGEMPGTPAILRDQMTLPYVIGTPFARALWRKGGWEAVRQAWSDPPESTEQVLHPEKYWSDERPLSATFEHAPRGGSLLLEGVLGETYARTLLGAGNEAAAAGWGGDRFKVWDVSGGTLLVWRSAWDTEADAREFEEALAARHRRTHAPATWEGGWSMFRKGDWTVATRRRHADLWLVSSDDPRVLQETLNTLTTGKGAH